MSSAQHEAASFVKNNVLISGCSTLCSFSEYRRYSYFRTQQCNMVSINSLVHNINHQSTIYCNFFCSFLESDDKMSCLFITLCGTLHGNSGVSFWTSHHDLKSITLWMFRSSATDSNSRLAVYFIEISRFVFNTNTVYLALKCVPKRSC